MGLNTHVTSTALPRTAIDMAVTHVSIHILMYIHSNPCGSRGHGQEKNADLYMHTLQVDIAVR